MPYSTDKWTTSEGEDRYRRSLYTFWRRTSPYPSFMTFDATSREYCTVRRVRTNTPLQALTLLNDPASFEAARALARTDDRRQGAAAPALARRVRLQLVALARRDARPSSIAWSRSTSGARALRARADDAARAIGEALAPAALRQGSGRAATRRTSPRGPWSPTCCSIWTRRSPRVTDADD